MIAIAATQLAVITVPGRTVLDAIETARPMLEEALAPGPGDYFSVRQVGQGMCESYSTDEDGRPVITTWFWDIEGQVSRTGEPGA